MEGLFSKLFSIFSIEYMFVVILASYLLIKLIDYINGVKDVPTWQKRVVTFVVGVIAFVVFYFMGNTSFECLIASYFAALFVYDTAVKFLLDKLGIEYKK